VTDPKETGKTVVPTRQPKKKTPGIFDNLRKLPERHPVEEILGLAPIEQHTEPTPSTPSTGSTPSIPSSRPEQKTASEISPVRDFTKVANSIVRNAIPAGIFGEYGSKAKEIYDYLYQQTRGAVVPKRKVRVPKERLMRGAGIGSEVTLRKNLMRLRAANLVEETVVPGKHGGNEYEVFLPEEIGLTGSNPLYPLYRGYTLSNREGLPPLDSRGSRPCPSPTDSTDYREDKTSLKDLRKIDDDDAALAGLSETLKSAVRELTGKNPSPTESERWRELAELLVTELKIAAARTNVSSVPAFLTEHLRRRLWKLDKRPAGVEGKQGATEEKSGLSTEQIKSCPDCGGSGMYYPDGYDKGVAKCKHEGLKSIETQTPG
jgi:hypothetical protein